MNRIVNFLAASLLLLAMTPLVILVALSVRVAHGPGVIVRRPGVGRNGQTFDQFGFRMTAGAERVPALPSASGLHDLPQLLNVLRGEMNIFGPRPLSPELARTRIARDPRYAARFIVKPGLFETRTFVAAR